jgi:hypothetical protein
MIFWYFLVDSGFSFFNHRRFNYFRVGRQSTIYSHLGGVLEYRAETVLYYYTGSIFYHVLQRLQLWSW